RKKEKEREAEEVDETTQTSSPGDWRSRLSTFLHVHRGSRASSRKSSRASDASDLSELGGPWLNLPLLLLSSAANVPPEDLDLRRESTDVVSIKVSQATPETGSPPKTTTPSGGPRRRSLYNFFLKHQDAVERPDPSSTATSPVALKKEFKIQVSPWDVVLLGPVTLHPSMAEELPMKRGSIVRRKRAGSVKVRPTSVTSTSGCHRTQSEKCTYSSDVAILVTEASPEGAITKPALNRQNSESTVVQVLVHRESEEYNQEDDQERTKLIRAIVPNEDQGVEITSPPENRDEGASGS
ncbi:sodium channel protein 60E-like, partial [Euwallacea similis]|uniref:sodium channel protein 60E-like n=1 Tax=Euwallacea similis TaxID=1736056 RepID=UPI00344DF51F